LDCETALVITRVLFLGFVLCFVALFISVVMVLRGGRQPNGRRRPGFSLRGLIGTPGAIAIVGFVACLFPAVIIGHVYGEDVGPRRHDSAANSYLLSKEVCERQARKALEGQALVDRITFHRSLGVR
jgi:hypothetical protein